MWVVSFSFHALQPHSSRVFLSHFCQEQTCPSHVHYGKPHERKVRLPHWMQRITFQWVRAPKTNTSLTPKPGFHYFPWQVRHKPSASTHAESAVFVLAQRSRPSFCQHDGNGRIVFRRRGMKDYMHRWQMALPPDKCDCRCPLCR